MMEASSGVKRTSALRAAFVLFGTIVGAGIFGLPYMVAQSGYGIGLFWMVALAGAVALTHLLFAEVIMATPGEHRLIGYVGEHLGPWARRIETVASILGLFGSSLAYLILGGLFISQIVSRIVPISPLGGSTILFLIGAIAVWGGTRFLAGVDFWLTLVEMSSFLLLSAVAFSAFKFSNLGEVHFNQAYLPYGVVLFAYGGLTAVTEVRAMVGDRPGAVRKSVIAGTLMAAALTMVFVTAVVGALGSATTTESVGGLNARIGGSIPLIGAIAGFFSILTSHIVISQYLDKQFRHDFKWKPFLAAFAAVGVPFLLFLLGVRSFGRILELVGATLIGVEGTFVCLMFLKIKKTSPAKMLAVPDALVYVLMAIYAGGALYELFFRLFRWH